MGFFYFRTFLIHLFYFKFKFIEEKHWRMSQYKCPNIIQASSILQPMDKRISNYIKKVVTEHGVTSTLKMKLLIEVFLKQSIFQNSPLPPKHNKRFWPSLKDIYNHMAGQFLKLRDSSFDQVWEKSAYAHWD